MVYLGSKSRIAKYIVPIIQSYINKNTELYLEPFVGGANVIDKINHHNKVGSDIHLELIKLLKKVQISVDDLPLTITAEEYKRVKENKEKYDSWYVGLVGFCSTFAAKYYGGFANPAGGRDIPAERIRNLAKQAANLQNIEFVNKSFDSWNSLNNCVIYCDPPYRGTTGYKTNKKFNYDEFYDWCRSMAETNTVLISEYSMPEDFECIWQKEHKTYMSANTLNKIEKLYKAQTKG